MGDPPLSHAFRDHLARFLPPASLRLHAVHRLKSILCGLLQAHCAAVVDSSSWHSRSNTTMALQVWCRTKTADLGNACPMTADLESAK